MKVFNQMIVTESDIHAFFVEGITSEQASPCFLAFGSGIFVASCYPLIHSFVLGLSIVPNIVTCIKHLIYFRFEHMF